MAKQQRCKIFEQAEKCNLFAELELAEGPKDIVFTQTIDRKFCLIPDEAFDP